MTLRNLLTGFFWASLLALGSPGVAADEAPESDSDAAEVAEGRLPLDELQLFVQIFDQIRSSYVEDVDDRELFEHAIEGLLAGLDPHSSYLTEESFEDLQESTSGKFGGLGIEVGMEDGFIRVVAPIDGTPADEAGIRTGDLIIKLDDKAVRGMNLGEAIEIMRGEPGTEITLTVLREGEEAPFEVTIERDIIKVESVRSEMLEENFGYVRIAQFQAGTGQDFRQHLQDMKADNPDLKGVVLDLRNNPGGLLPSAIEVADVLLDGGLVVYTEGRLPSAEAEYRATEGDLLGDTPVVVIINGGSASASEILAGALQDNDRAVVIGTRSFGKGSVQTVLPLREDKAIKLTTARYFTPAGTSIQAQGIRPDILVEPAEIKVLEQRQNLSEASLSGHLENTNGDEETEQEPDSTDARLSEDNQLYEALNILKGIAIFRQ